MSLLKKFHEINKEICKNASPVGTGMGGNFLMDAILDKATQPYIEEGKKVGYEQASDEYEKKLLQQADMFLKQMRDAQTERDAYEKLLDEYEHEIDRLSSKLDRTETENKYLQELLLKERALRKLWNYGLANEKSTN